MELTSLKLRNFKGVKDFELITQGGNVSIFGENATGKTTIYDAFLWLLFDKDSQNKKDFAIKTLDAEGNEIHNLEHEVEAVLDIDGAQLTLRKVYAEKWTKKRGSATSEFTGHTTDYFVDGVPVKKKEYEDRITKIVPEEIFKLLTSPAFFNEQLHWEGRRKILLEVCGDLTDEEVIASDKALARLPSILGNRTLEDHRKVIAARRSEINKVIMTVPIRIDEATRALPDISNIPTTLPTDIEKLNNLMLKKMDECNLIEQGGGVGELRKKMASADVTMAEIEMGWSREKNKLINAQRAELSKFNSQIDGLQRNIGSYNAAIGDNNKTMRNIDINVVTLRDEWVVINAEEFAFEQSDTCPTCKQALPSEQVEEARAKALAQFNLDKATDLAEITENGQALAGQINDLKEQSERSKPSVAEAKEKLDELTTKADSLKANIEVQEEALAGTGYTTDPAYIKALFEQEALHNDIDDLQNNSGPAVAKVKEEISSLRAQLDKDREMQQQITMRSDGLSRITELEDQEHKLAAEYAKLEGELFLADQFVKTKVSLLEEKINSKFKLARFKLFETQINGGISEMCETIYNGVPYSSGLNNAARINTGLDIINTLSEHYGFTAPIFVDNAEAVCELIPVKAQVISLVVSAPDKVLRVETDDKQTTLFEEAV